MRNEADLLLNVLLLVVGVFGASEVSFQAMGFYSPLRLGAKEAMSIMEAYMASYILGTDSFGHRELTVPGRTLWQSAFVRLTMSAFS